MTTANLDTYLDSIFGIKAITRKPCEERTFSIWSKADRDTLGYANATSALGAYNTWLADHGRAPVTEIPADIEVD